MEISNRDFKLASYTFSTNKCKYGQVTARNSFRKSLDRSILGSNRNETSLQRVYSKVERSSSAVITPKKSRNSIKLQSKFGSTIRAERRPVSVPNGRLTASASNTGIARDITLSGSRRYDCSVDSPYMKSGVKNKENEECNTVRTKTGPQLELIITRREIEYLSLLKQEIVHPSSSFDRTFRSFDKRRKAEAYNSSNVTAVLKDGRAPGISITSGERKDVSKQRFETLMVQCFLKYILS